MRLPIIPPADIKPSTPVRRSITFGDVARTILAGLGSVAATVGIFGLTSAMATSIAAPSLIPAVAVLAGAVLFIGGAAIVMAAWQRQHLIQMQSLQMVRQAAAAARGVVKTSQPAPGVVMRTINKIAYQLGVALAGLVTTLRESAAAEQGDRSGHRIGPGRRTLYTYWSGARGIYKGSRYPARTKRSPREGTAHWPNDARREHEAQVREAKGSAVKFVYLDDVDEKTHAA